MSSQNLNQVFWFVVVVVLVWQDCVDAQNGRSRLYRQRGRNRNGPRRGGLDPDLHAAYMNALSNVTTTPSESHQPDPWVRRTPSTPAPDEVDCHMNVVVTQQLDGRCIRLGGQSRPYACQSGEVLRIKPECEDIINSRNGKK